MHTDAVLQHLKKHGQLLDSDIAKATKIALSDVHAALAKLSAQREITQCSLTTFKDGKATESIQCRIFGYFPPAAPGRKPATKSN